MRNEGTELEAAVKEALDIGDAAQMPGRDLASQGGRAEPLGRSGQGAGDDRCGAGQGHARRTPTSISTTPPVPRWASAFRRGRSKADRTQINKRLDDAATWIRIKEEMKKLIRERGLENYSFARIASYRTRSRAERACPSPMPPESSSARTTSSRSSRLMRRMLRAGGASMVYQFMAEDDIGRILRHPFVVDRVGQRAQRDGRGRAASARLWQQRPRARALRARAHGRQPRGGDSQDDVAARRSFRRFANRGRLAAGQAADIVIFDPSRIADRATYEKPHQYPDGDHRRLVNGVPVVTNGDAHAARPGKCCGTHGKGW